ncbi:hypothetical protein EZV62_024413 [Acer yangbiense]|uniref:Retrovirus-related Pol polyprotein from transposon TNT 1-94 n=1 Tax=Acer yangbiense TaxID=1000413 RepID=A0A5C7GV29_9ROSI|nr:hypothetical protein EZV62_024413 [Acer yangbiense]
MVSTKFKIEKFNGKGDFGMWRKKMKAILVQQKCVKALEEEKDLPISLSAEEKQDLLETAYSTIILNLADNVLRQVNDEDTAAKVWIKLESFYMNKSLSGKIYLKEQLFGFKMDQSKSLEDNLDDFSKLNIELANSDSKEALSDENQAIIVFNSLSNSYKDLKAAIKYGRDSLSLEDVLRALRSREMEMRSEKRASIGEGLNVRGRSEKKGSNYKGREDELPGLLPATQTKDKDAKLEEKVQIEVEPSQDTEPSFSDIPEVNEEQAEEHFEEEDDLQDYLLARDREKRHRKTPQRYGYADVVAYALNTAIEESDEEEMQKMAKVSYASAIGSVMRGSDQEGSNG